jgi:glycosyltransferase involved in cell wall biosynthesis
VGPATCPALGRELRRVMSERADVLILIPAFNEEKNLPQVIEEARSAVPEALFLVVDDGSRDRTGEVARAAGARVVSLAINLGYGAAVQTGFQFAARSGASRVVLMDGDGQHDPRSIPRLLEVDPSVDVVRGSRFLGCARYRVPFARRAGMVIFGWLAGVFTGDRVTDVTSGFQALSPRAVRFLGENYPTDYPDADIVIHGVPGEVLLLRVQDVSLDSGDAPAPGAEAGRAAGGRA